jgi:hypothetical protein
VDTVSAFIVEGHPLERVARHLPANYAALSREDGAVTVVGVDTAGWTLDGYVLPRLASGGIRPAHLTPVHGQVPCVVGDYVRQLAYALTDARRDLEAVPA